MRTQALIALSLALAVGGGVLWTVFAGRSELSRFEAGAAAALARADALADRALSFTDEKLRDPTRSSLNGFYFRFDDRAAGAAIEAAERSGGDRSRDTASPAPDRVEFAPLTPGGSPVRYNLNPISVDAGTLAEIEIRMRASRTRLVQLGWHADERATFEGGGFGAVNLDLIPDGAFHSYRLAAEVLGRKLPRGQRVRRFYLAPVRGRGGDLEIEYVELVAKADRYREREWGRSYEKIGDEMRAVLHSVTPASLVYSLDLPEGDIRLAFGMAVLEAESVEFRVSVLDPHDAGAARPLLRRRVEAGETWNDARLDLSPWSGRAVQLVLETQSERPSIAFWSNPILYQPPVERFNVVFILQDALRADHLSSFGYDRPTSPRTDAFVQQGVVFERAFAQASKTRPSVASFMTGLFPTATGVWDHVEVLASSYGTLAEILRGQGFATASFLLNGNAGPSAGIHQGFGSLFASFEAAPAGGGERHDPRYRAREVFHRALDWIDQHSDRNRFAYVHLLDPHGPYDPPPPHDLWYRPEEERATRYYLDPAWVKVPTSRGRRQLYDGEIRYNDEQIADFLDALQDRELDGSTLVILASDHGEHLGERGLWEHSPPGYAQVLHVPLAMVLPGRLPSKRRVTEPVALIDIVPTVLELAGIERRDLLLQGASLVPLMRGESAGAWQDRPVLSDEVIGRSKDDAAPWGSVFFRQWHVLNSRSFGPDAEVLLFDHVRDPQEERPIAGESRFEAQLIASSLGFLAKLQGRNLEIWRAMVRRSDEEIRLDPETQERLRALGYLGGEDAVREDR